MTPTVFIFGIFCVGGGNFESLIDSECNQLNSKVPCLLVEAYLAHVPSLNWFKLTHLNSNHVVSTLKFLKIDQNETSLYLFPKRNIKWVMLQVNYVIQGSMEPRCICKEWNVGVFEKMEPRCIRVILDYILTSASLNLNFGYIYGFFL